MTRHIAAVCGALAISGMTMTAQTPQPKTTRPDAPKAPRAAAGMMTVTGCVASADAKSSGRAGAVSKYVLTNVQPAADGAKPATGTAAEEEQTFALVTEGTTVDLSKHLNHKVELTGTMDTTTQRAPEASSTGTAGSTGTATLGRDAAAMRMPIATLKVTALKMVSATCP